MKRNISAFNTRLLSLYTLLIATGFAVGLYATSFHADVASHEDRIEIGLAEVSPRGDAGGYAVPASGESVTITASPSTVASGGASTLTYSLSDPQGHGLAGFGCTVYDNDYNYYGNGFGAAGPSGSISTGPLTQTKVFNYACNVEDNDPNTWFGVSVTNSTTVTVSTAVNGVCTNTSPTTRCTSGTYFNLSDDTYYDYWQCLGSNGGTSQSNTANCRAESGRCSATYNTCNTGTFVDVADTSTANWDCYPPAGTFPGGTGGNVGHCSLPMTSGSCGASTNTCTAGTFSDVTDTSANNLWNCTGSNGGGTASCSTPKTSGSCGSSINSCTVGTLSDTADDASNNNWSCTGSNGGSTASCSIAKTNGSCGSSNNSCVAGTLSDTADTSTDYLWSCSGSNNGTTASCSAPKPISGVCGGSINSCTVGTLSDTADDASNNNWSCTGSNGGSTASCSIAKTNAVCGGSINSCSVGTFNDDADTGAANLWHCVGANNGTDASCSITKTNGSCGGSTNTCSAGTFNDDPDTASNNVWHCDGANNGTTASCTSAKVNGSCGSSVNACTAGSLSDTADTSANNLWNCSGSNNGTTASCSYPKTNAVCGSSINSCSVGTFNDDADTSANNLWHCVGAYNGTDASCAVAKVDGVCGASINSCNSGTFNDDPDTANDNVWHCNGSNNGVNGSCTYPKTNGVCGSTVNSCTAGAFQDVTDSGTQKLWNCNGSNNGSTAACSIAFLNCSLDGVTVNHGSSRVFYTAQSGTCDSSTQQTRTCNDGSLSGSGSYQYASCTISPPTTSLTGRSSTMSSDRTAPDSFSVEPNETLSFAWSSQYTASCGINFGSSQALSGSISGVSVPAPGVASNYTFQCTGLNGTQSSKTFTIVTRERKPVLVASASRVSTGSSITLTYQMNGNTSCTFSGPPQINGRVVTGNGTTEGIIINGQTTFTLACPGGSNSVTVFVNGSVQEQ